MNAAEPAAAGRLVLEPIGYARTDLPTKVDAPRQPRAAGGQRGRIELLPGRHFEHALEDLDGWEYIWVVFWFHLNPSWRPKVLPPRSTSGRKGVFSTRSPHRPNPLGLSALRLERIEGLTLHVAGVDLVDGTPVLDIKPYVAYTDAHPAARSGWLDDEARATDAASRTRVAQAGTAGAATARDPVEPFVVHFAPEVEDRLAWIESRTGLALRERARRTLALGPAPHPYRRIRADGDAFRLAIRDWRLRFVVDGRQVRVIDVTSGYRPSQLARETAGEDPVLAVHRAFRDYR